MRTIKNKKTTCITLNQAKSMKILGFNEPTKVYYWIDGGVSFDDDATYQQHSFDGDVEKETFSAPTILEAAEWLNNFKKHGQLFKDLVTEINDVDE